MTGRSWLHAGISSLVIACCCAAPGNVATTPKGARQGLVRLSTRKEALRGLVYRTKGKPLRVWDPAKRRSREYRLDEVERIEILVAKQQMIRDWRFKEEGSAEKIFTSPPYPRIDFSLRLTLAKEEKPLDCRIIQGQNLYLQAADGEKRRFTLQPYMTGKPEQAPDPLEYVMEIDFRPPDEADDAQETDPAAVQVTPEQEREEATEDAAEPVAPAPTLDGAAPETPVREE